MKRFTLHQVLCATLVPLMAATSLMAADADGAIVYVSGSTSVNGAAISRPSAVFPGDTIRTSSSSQANVNSSGASVTIFENSSVEFERAGVSLQDGSVNIGAYKKELSASVGNVTVTPASSDWTEFKLSRRNGAVQITARKGDLNVSDGKESVTMLQGQSTTREDSTTRDDSDKRKERKRDEPIAAAMRNPVLDSPVWIGIGAAAITAGLIYALTRNGSPVSPVTP